MFSTLTLCVKLLGWRQSLTKHTSHSVRSFRILCTVRWAYGALAGMQTPFSCGTSRRFVDEQLSSHCKSLALCICLSCMLRWFICTLCALVVAHGLIKECLVMNHQFLDIFLHRIEKNGPSTGNRLCASLRSHVPEEFCVSR